MVKDRHTQTISPTRHSLPNKSILFARLVRRAFRRFGQAIHWRRWGFDGVPVLFANSFPKSGTHLLTQILGGFSKLGPAVNSGLPAVVTFWGDSGLQRSEPEILADLARYLPGDIGYGHLHATPALVSALTQEKFVSFFIIRDPRDVVVSHVHYITEMEPTHIHHLFYTQNLHTFEDRLRTSIQGIPPSNMGSSDEFLKTTQKETSLPDPTNPSFPDVYSRFQPYLEWCQQPAVLTIRYENFIDDQTNTILKILKHAVGGGFPLDFDLDNAVEILKDQIDPQRSPTFRTGKTGGWKEAFSPENKQIFKEIAGGLLITLGYEKDYNW